MCEASKDKEECGYFKIYVDQDELKCFKDSSKCSYFRHDCLSELIFSSFTVLTKADYPDFNIRNAENNNLMSKDVACLQYRLIIKEPVNLEYTIINKGNKLLSELSEVFTCVYPIVTYQSDKDSSDGYVLKQITST